MGSRLTGKKQRVASSHLKIYLTLAIFIIFSFTFLFKITVTQRLFIMHQLNKEVYLTADVSQGDKLTYGWMHSLEHIPWTEDYYIQENNHLLLSRITIVGFGAGIPHNKGKVTRIEDGTIVIEQIDEDFEKIDWIHSQTAMEYIKLNDQTIVKGPNLPHHEPLKLKIEKRFKVCRRSR
jgi:hypothetical protein